MLLGPKNYDPNVKLQMGASPIEFRCGERAMAIPAVYDVSLKNDKLFTGRLHALTWTTCSNSKYEC